MQKQHWSMPKLLMLALLACCGASTLCAEAEDLYLARPSASETPRFRESHVGEWANTHFVTWSPRYFNVTDIRGFDDSFSRRLLTSMGYFTVKYELQSDFRLSDESWFSLRPSAGVGYGYSTMTSHEEFRLNSVNRYVDTRTKFGIGQAIGDLGLSVGYRYRSHEVFADWQSVFALRFQRLKSLETSKIDPVTGLQDSLQSPVRTETHKAWLHSLGYGYAVHFGGEPWNFRFSLEHRPFAHVEWQDRTIITSGFGLGFQSHTFRLSDDVGLALHFRCDFYLPKDDFNDIFWFEIGVGIRFS